MEDSDAFDSFSTSRMKPIRMARMSSNGTRTFSSTAIFTSQRRSERKQAPDGLFVAQNRDALTANGMGVYDMGKPRNIPDFLNERWYPRVDLTIAIRRCVTRIYPILNLLSAEGTIYGEGSSLITVPFTVTNEE